MKTQTQHTPMPWKISNINGMQIELPGEKVRGSVRVYSSYEDAAFIVRAVNCHEELLATVKMAFQAEQSLASEVKRSERLQRMVNIIAKAEGK